MIALALAQTAAGTSLSAWGMVIEGTFGTKAILAIIAVLSLLSWAIILWKLFQFRRVHREAGIFLDQVERADRLEVAFRNVLALAESPFTRVFRRGVNFYSELRPGGLKEGAQVAGLSPAQLEVLRLVLEKDEGEERDELSHGLQWLAITAAAGPLLGLLGTVIGVMNTFIGVAALGSANITAVAPGVAQALITTVAGLIAAIPAAIAYNYFATRLQLLMSELEGFSSEFIGTLAREGKV